MRLAYAKHRVPITSQGYVPAYMAAVFGLRTTAWTVGLIGLGIMGSALLSS